MIEIKRTHQLARPLKWKVVMTRRSILAAVVSVLAGATAPIAAQDAARQAPVVTFKSSVEVVSLAAAVRDRRGRVVRNLTQSDFEVYDGGIRREIRDFYAGDSPVSLAVLLDISGSMAVGRNMDRAREAVAVAMRNLRPSSDEAALFTFDSQLAEVVQFTTDLDRVRRVSLEGRPWGKTSLFDAIAETAKTVAERTNRHRAVLVITDGIDTGSRLSAPEVSGIASSIDVPVYLLTVVTPLDHPGTEFAVLQSDSRVAETATLADLARWTGGDMRIASVPAHTVTAVRDLFAELRHQYLITFEPGASPGWHPLEIRTRKKNLIVHARSGYWSGPSRTGS
jgi:Ca-activated chloride channel family protein